MIKFIIWGTGNRAEKQYKVLMKTSLIENIEIIGFVDNDCQMWGKTFNGKLVYSPNKLVELQFDYIDIWVFKHRKEIVNQITDELKIPFEKLKDILDYYKQIVCDIYQNSEDKDIKEFLRVFKNNKGISVFAYEPEKVDESREAIFDDKSGLYYVIFDGKRLYLSRTYNDYIIIDGKKFVPNLWQEQDLYSPHRYEQNQVFVAEGDILVDAGVCEGNFSLHNIDKVKKVYLIECDPYWMEALHYTFKPYEEKVVYCNKFLSDKNSESTITLDSLIKEPIDFIKMDIEGEEVNALKGANNVLSQNKSLKCSICSYHKHGDEEKIKNILTRYGIQTSSSKGYMLFLYDENIWENPELRRGVVRGYKRIEFN